MERLNLMAECAAFVVMLGLSIIIGIYYGCVAKNQNTVSEYLLGGKKMSVFPITMSLIASHVSGITLLGVPSEVYKFGTQYLIVTLTNAISVVIIIYIYLPVFYELQLTSVYEYLERRFGSNIRTLASINFAVSVIVMIPVVIYTPALVIHQVIGLNVHLVTPVFCIVCIFYTTVGGLKAVVWTDAIQSIFTALSVIIIIVMGLIQVGGFGNMITANQEGGRIEFFNMDPDPFRRNTFWTVSIGITLLYVSQLGVHPGTIQRCVSLPTYKMAKQSLIYFSFGMAVVKILTALIGMLIYTNYKDCDPVSAKYIPNDKYLLPYYVVNVVGKLPGITGLFISGIVSAALSTMSANLNTLSGTIYEDVIVKIMGVKVSDSTASVIMKCTVVVTGIMCVALVMVVEKMKGLLQMTMSLISITSGPTLSVFTLGLCFPMANSKGAMYGLLVSFGVMFWIVTGAQLAITNTELKYVEKDVSIAGCPNNLSFNNSTNFSGLYKMNEDVYVSPNVMKLYTVSFMHYTTVGALTGIIVGLAVSLLFPTDEEVDPKLISPCIRKFMYPDYMIGSRNKSNGTKAEDYTLVSQDTKL